MWEELIEILILDVLIYSRQFHRKLFFDPLTVSSFLKLSISI